MKFSIYHIALLSLSSILCILSIPIEKQQAKEAFVSVSTENPIPKPIDIESAGHRDKKILIYCTHHWESYRFPVIDPKNKTKSTIIDRKHNVIDVARQLRKEFEKRGVGAIFACQKYRAKKAYQKSKKLVMTVTQKTPGIQYYIDVHRDLQKRYITTQTFNNKKYARFIFVVGSSGRYFKENLHFATSLHNQINDVYPRLSRSVIIKKRTSQDNGEYNQSLSPHCLLVEIGGSLNSREETDRSIQIIAEMISRKIHTEFPVNSSQKTK